MLSRIFIIFTVIILASCDNDSSKSEYPLISIYKEVLVTREMYQDSSVANKKIDSIFSSHHLTEDRFRQDIIKLSGNKKDFSRTIDSLRSLVKSEIDSIRRSELKEFIQ